MAGLVSLILMLHSINRWLIVVAAIVALVVYAMTWLNNSPMGQNRRPMMIYTGLMDLQVLLGAIVLVGMAAYPRYQLEHATTNLIAVLLAHFLPRLRAATPQAQARNNVLAVVVSLLIIIAGVAVLPQGWFG